MIKRLRKRFIIFNLLVISIVFMIVGGIITFNNMEMMWHRLVVSCIVFLGLAFISSVLLANSAIKPIEKAWKRQLDFTADASHELRTPLAVMQTSLEIILENEEESVKSQREWLENIVLEHQRMTNLVQDLLTLSRGDTHEQVLNIEHINIEEVINEVRSEFLPIALKRGIDIETRIKLPLSFEGDLERIKQLLIILVDNAIKYMGHPGKITVEAYRQYGLASRDKEVILQVSDTGQGIAKEHLEKIFERFYRVSASRSEEGSGLGLAIAKWIVDSHGGNIKVLSQVGEGTQFTIQLPIKPKEKTVKATDLFRKIRLNKKS